MPSIDAAAQADAQVTVSIVLAGFAFAGFILLMDNLRDARSDKSQDLYFQSMFLLGATFSIGALSSFFYAVSRGVAPWSAYQAIQFGHALFTLETLALIASVGWLLGIYAPIGLRLQAWYLMCAISSYALIRFCMELIRHSRDGVDGQFDTVVIGAIAAVAVVIALVLGRNKKLSEASQPVKGEEKLEPGQLSDETRAVMRYVVALAVTSLLIAVPQLIFTFVDAARPLPSIVAAWLMAMISVIFVWTIVITWPSARPDEVVAAKTLKPWWNAPTQRIKAALGSQKATSSD